MSHKLLLLSVCGFLLFVIWVRYQIYYRITRRHVEVRLFGFTLRRIELTDIRRISKKEQKNCEKWPNTYFPRKKRLILQRRTGVFRNFMITPNHRYIFKAELKKKITRRWEEIRGAQKVPATAPPEELVVDEDPES